MLDRLTSGDGLTPGLHVADELRIGEQAIILRRHVLSFFQGNRYLLRDLITHVVEQVPSGTSVIDLYAGTGLFSVAAAVVRSARVTAVEGDRYAAADLTANARALAASVEAIYEPVEAFVSCVRDAPAATVVVDPPRTGMSREALEGTIGLRPARLVYVSCDVATLARDVRR